MERYQAHYRKCFYPSCGLTNRKRTGSHISFFKFPTDDDRRITWLMHCGLDDWVGMSSAELRNKYVCSRHFSKDSFHPSGRLRDDAKPKIVNSFDSAENKAATDNENDDVPLKQDYNELKQKLIEAQAQLQRQRNKIYNVRLQIREKSEVINRLKHKLSSGDIDDDCLEKAISQRLSGPSLTFVSRLLFKTEDRTSFTKEG